MPELLDRFDATGIGVYVGVLASFTEKNLHLEDKRWDLDVVGAACGIAVASYVHLEGQDIQPIEAFIKRQHDLEVSKKEHDVSCSVNDLFFEHLLDKSATQINWSTVQIAQYEHDVQYHRDVVNPGNAHHLKHNTLHLAMINGKLLQSLVEYDLNKLYEHYLSALIFSVKSLTSLGKTLPDNSKSPSYWRF